MPDDENNSDRNDKSSDIIGNDGSDEILAMK
jgi:hypothetical protein